MLEDVLPCKTTLTVNAITVKAANTSQSGSTWNPGACTYQNTTDNYRKAGAFCWHQICVSGEGRCVFLALTIVKWGRGANIFPLLAFYNYFNNKGIHCIWNPCSSFWNLSIMLHVHVWQGRNYMINLFWSAGYMDKWTVYKCVLFSDTVGSHEVHGNYDSIFTLCSEPCQEAITSTWWVEPL